MDLTGERCNEMQILGASIPGYPDLEEEYMKKLSFVLFTLGLTGVLSLGVFRTAVVQAKSKKTFTLDVAQDSRTFRINPADPAAPLARSGLGVVNGTIYPEGTLPSGETTFDPSTPGGIGTWRCVIAILAEPPLTGAVTYYFSLGQTKDGSEKSMLIVQGLNSHFVGSKPRILAIVGGTGELSRATGEVVEEVIGTNMTPGALNLRYTFTLKKHAPK
jgi:hypothetical protein